MGDLSYFHGKDHKCRREHCGLEPLGILHSRGESWRVDRIEVREGGMVGEEWGMGKKKSLLSRGNSISVFLLVFPPQRFLLHLFKLVLTTSFCCVPISIQEPWGCGEVWGRGSMLQSFPEPLSLGCGLLKCISIFPLRWGRMARMCWSSVFNLPLGHLGSRKTPGV